MKLNDIKHNHSLTDLLKVSIFSLCMLAPMLSIGVKCAYVICNKNAYLSYTENYELLQQKMNNSTELIQGNEYLLHYESNNNSTNYSKAYGFTTTSFDISTFGENLNITHIGYLAYSTGRYRVYGINNNSIDDRYYSDYMDNLPDITFISTGNTITVSDGYVFYSLYQNIYKKGTLDNVFEYSVSQIETDPLFNWVQNTAIYDGIHAMNTGLGITYNALSIMLAYWLLLTVTYIVIDIVLKVFTYLTHMIGSKTSH